MMQLLLPVLYLLAAAGFILALKWMSSPATARRGVIAGFSRLSADSGCLAAVAHSTDVAHERDFRDCGRGSHSDHGGAGSSATREGARIHGRGSFHH